MDLFKERDKREWLEIRSTIILSIATLAITWCTYQSNLWTGIQIFRLAESNKNSRLAQQEVLLAAQQQQIDVAIIMNFVNAVLEKGQKLVDFHLERVRPDLVKILGDWLAMDPLNNKSAPPTPSRNARLSNSTKIPTVKI